MTSSPVLPSAAAEFALLQLLGILQDREYRFVTPTPATHARVIARRSSAVGGSLRDIFGWSLPFDSSALDPAILSILEQGDALEALGDGRCRSRYRISSLHDLLYLHSAYPTDAEDAVFFGPDSYRFADLIRREMSTHPLQSGAHIVDIGTGAGVGGIVAARGLANVQLSLTDINPAALRLAGVNARFADVDADLVRGAGVDNVSGQFDLALANPPYIVDDAERSYRDGGGMHGGEVALHMVRDSLDRLAPGGRMILYTGSAIIGGEDVLARALTDLAGQKRCTLDYAELDPDVFGEELDKPAYRDVERIAVVSAIFRRDS